MAKEFKNGQWIEIQEAPPAPARFVDPRDIEPQPPASCAGDHDHPRWVKENMRYLEKLGEYRSRQSFKAEHPELKGKSWHVEEKG